MKNFGSTFPQRTYSLKPLYQTASIRYNRLPIYTPPHPSSSLHPSPRNPRLRMQRPLHLPQPVVMPRHRGLRVARRDLRFAFPLTTSILLLDLVHLLFLDRLAVDLDHRHRHRQRQRQFTRSVPAAVQDQGLGEEGWVGVGAGLSWVGFGGVVVRDGGGGRSLTSDVG